MIRLRLPIVLAMLAVLSCAQQSPPAESPAAAPAAAEQRGPDQPALLTGLGDYHFPITTSSEEAQRYFDQGMVLTYGFNHAAAVRSFAEAEKLDADCAMCAWGQAYALGPNINAPMGPEAGAAAYDAAQRAVKLAKGPNTTERERDYVAAVAQRYGEDPTKDRAELDARYAGAMKDLARKYPDDVDAAVLYAESLMDLSPWNYWGADGKAGPHTDELMAALEWALAVAPDHVGANHYYIHAVEEYYPERGVPAADRLGNLAPEAGHLVHMPSHIYWRVGRYEDAMEINQRAAAADEEYFAICRPSALYRGLYYPHNIHFLWAAAAAEGRSDIALSAARKLEAKTKLQLAEFPFMQEFMSTPQLTLVRFGRFDEVLGMPVPDIDHRFLRGISNYSRGIAQARAGDIETAEGLLTELKTVQADPETAELMLAGGVASAATLLDIAVAHLEGEIATANGNQAAAVAALERAVAMQDELAYMEPPPWYFPTRQALGAAQLAAGEAAAAEATYRKDLEQYPANGWSLFGLSQALEAQDREVEARWAMKGYQNAFSRADVQLQRSIF